MTTLSVTLRKGARINTNGLAPVCFHVNADGRRHQFSTGIKIAPAHFDEQKERVLKTAPSYLFVNGLLEGYKSKAQQYIYSQLTAGAPFDARAFSETVFAKDRAGYVDNLCFYNLLKAYVDATPMSYGTCRLYMRTIERLQELYPKLPVEKVGFDVVSKFRNHLRDKHSIKNAGTMKNYIKSVKAVVHFASRLGHKTDSTIAMIRSTAPESNRQHLSFANQASLYDKYMAGKIQSGPHRTAIGSFLLSSYTGLRYCDIAKLAGKAEKILHDGCVKIMQQKTLKPLSIPLSNNAIALLHAGALNKILSNQKSNFYLKEALKKHMEISDITFHCARHTFATNCILLGIPAEVVQQFLGHKKIQTTLIYAKVADEVKLHAMQKWNAAVVLEK